MTWGHSIDFHPDGTDHFFIKAGMQISRIDNQGIPDLTFGNNGIIDLDPEHFGNYQYGSVIRRADGKIVVVGKKELPGNEYDEENLRVARYNTDYTLDVQWSFAWSGGNYGQGRPVGASIAEDGDILIVGSAWEQSGYASIRIGNDGTVKYRDNVRYNSKLNWAFCSAELPTGGFIFGGIAEGEPILTKVTRDGVFDTSFGSNRFLEVTSY